MVKDIIDPSQITQKDVAFRVVAKIKQRFSDMPYSLSEIDCFVGFLVLERKKNFKMLDFIFKKADINLALLFEEAEEELKQETCQKEG